MITVTLQQIIDARPCYDPRDKGLLAADHDLNVPITFNQIVELVGVDNAIWCLRATEELTAISRQFALDCAERVRHLMADERSTNALDVAKRYLTGEASEKELAAARVVAHAAINDTIKVIDCAAARTAARDVAHPVAGSAARSAAMTAAKAISWSVSCANTRVAALIAERKWQAARLIELTEEVNLFNRTYQ